MLSFEASSEGFDVLARVVVASKRSRHLLWMCDQVLLSSRFVLHPLLPCRAVDCCSKLPLFLAEDFVWETWLCRLTAILFEYHQPTELYPWLEIFHLQISKNVFMMTKEKIHVIKTHWIVSKSNAHLNSEIWRQSTRCRLIDSHSTLPIFAIEKIAEDFGTWRHIARLSCWHWNCLCT